MKSLCISCKNLKKEQYCYGSTKYYHNFKTEFCCDERNAPDNMYMSSYPKSKLPVITECKAYKSNIFDIFYTLRNKWRLFWILND